MEERQYSLKSYLESVEVKDPFGHLNLTLVTLHGASKKTVDYMLGADAIRSGVMTVSEVSESGSVPELLVDNKAEVPVLLLDGEELVGAKQNRILNTTVLVPAKSKVNIPVSCVEQGRWRHTSSKFDVGSHSPSTLRAKKSRSVSHSLRTVGAAMSDQGEVWDDVRHHIARLDAHSPTSSMHDAFHQRGDCLGAYIDALPYRDGSRGVIVAIDGKFAAVDLFDRPDTLELTWSRLVTGYAFDAIGSEASDNPKTFSLKGAREVVEHLKEMDCQPCPTVGLGEDWRFESEAVVGQALVAAGACVHLCAFPNGDSGSVRHLRSRIASPSHRRRNTRRDD